MRESRSTPHRIEYSPEAEEHLKVLTTRQQVLILDNIDKQLIYQPTVETRNRKRMRPNPVALWELRIDDLRVYYTVYESGKRMLNYEET